jgi:hypothetical protein
MNRTDSVLTDQRQPEGVLRTLVLIRIREQHVSQNIIRQTVLITTNQQKRVLKPKVGQHTGQQDSKGG